MNTLRAILATVTCRLYALLPCVLTVLLAGVLAAVPHGAALAAGLTALACAALLATFADFRAAWAHTLGNALLFGGALALPALLLSTTALSPLAAFGAGAGLELVLDALLLWLLPKLERHTGAFAQLELYPDALTAFVLVALCWVPLQWLRLAGRRNGAANDHAPVDCASLRIAILVCAHDEAGTIARCITSLRESALAARLEGAHVQVLLVDSGSTDDTRARAVAAGVDAVLAAPPGKLSARDHALRAADAELLVLADGDRAYDKGWLRALVRPLLESPDVVAVTGETRNAGGPMNGSELTRRALTLPFNGGNSALWKWAYLRAPHDVRVEQFEHRTLWREEEFLFPLRLMAHGRVVYAPGCRAYELRPYPLLRQLARHLFGVRLKTF